MQSHLEKICRNHPQFFGGQDHLEKLLPRLLAILNHERKNAQERAAHARGKAGKCDFAPLLLGKADITRGFQGDEAIRVLNLFDFLSTRRVATSDGLLHYPTPAWIYQQVEFAKADSAAVAQNQPRIRTTPTELKRTLLESLNQALGLTGKEALKWEKGSSLNKDYFDQLKDLLCLRRTNFDKRASISSEAAGFITSSLLTSPVERVSAINDALSEYRKLRRDRLRSIITSPQVEFLLGGEGRPEGRIQRIFASEEVTKALGKKTKPDFVVIEVVGGAARNTLEAFEIRKAQLEGRKHREELIKKYEINEADAKGETMLRVSLFEQQRGICPYSGKPLGSPTASSLEIDHIFPREMGGTSEKRNLVLAFRECNAAKGKRLPYEAAKAGDLPLDWKEILKVCSTMKWGVVNKDGALNKRTIFESLQDSSKCPDWGNLTRQSQIARELRDSAAQWMGIKGDATKMAQCIGTPTGLHTAVCRRAWKQSIPRKNRADLTHHLWDAITVSFIPPAKGLNTIEYGGIFHHVTEKSAAVTEMTALAICPDLSALDQQTGECLVEHPRQSSSKKRRFDKKIYGRNADGMSRIREPLVRGEGVARDERSLYTALKAAGVPDEKIPPTKSLRAWLDAERSKKLLLKDGTVVESLPIAGKKSGSIMAQLPHRNALHEEMGFRLAKEANWRLEIWKTTTETTTKYHTRVVPHPRLLKLFKQTYGQRAWNTKRPNGSETWRHFFTGKLPKYAFKAGHYQKGQVVLVPLMQNGKIAPSFARAYKQVHYRVTAINGNGQVEMKIATVKAPSEQSNEKWPFRDLPPNCIQRAPKSAAVLAMLLAGE